MGRSVRTSVVVLLSLAGLLAAIPGANASAPAATVQGAYSPIAPVRVLDTRPGAPALTNPGVAIHAGSPLDLQVAGRSDVPQVPANASAVVMNVTVTNPNGSGYLSVFPTGTSPSVSNLNFTVGQTIPNLVTVQLSAAGHVTFAVGPNVPSLDADVIADIQGYYIGGTAAVSTQAAGTFVPITPVRLYDTRATTGPTNATNGTPVPASTPLTMQIANLQGVASDASAVVLNVTVTEPQGDGFASVRPGDATGVPSVSNLNFTAGETIPNLVTVPLSGGQVQYFSNVTTHVVVDLAGYYAGGTPTVIGAFHSLTPSRILDTRSPAQPGVPQFSAGQTNYLQIENPPTDGSIYSAAGVPVDGVSAVVLNATVTDAAARGYLSVFSSDLASPPDASNLNYGAGKTIANSTIPQVGADGAVGFYSQAGVNLIADLSGYFIGPNWNFETGQATTNHASANSVSCPSTTFCAAGGVGTVSIYSANPNAWGWRSPTSLLTSSQGSVTADIDVSCASSSFCVATDGSSSTTYNGTDWSMPVQTGERTPWARLACPEVNFCMLLSPDSGGGAAYATFDGSTWTASGTVGPNGTPYAISCVSASFCMAGNPSGQVRIWDGQAWSALQQLPGTPVRISGVSCSSAASCSVVGTPASPAGADSVVFEWDATSSTSWVGPFDLGYPNAKAISCAPSSSACVVVDGSGYFRPSNAPDKYLTSYGSPLNAVSCPTETFCATVDGSGEAFVGRYS